MKTIYKYRLAITDMQLLQVPAHAQVLTLQLQDDAPCLWLLVDTANPLSEMRVQTVATGQRDLALDCYQYVGTYQDDLWVFHVFIQQT